MLHLNTLVASSLIAASVVLPVSASASTLIRDTDIASSSPPQTVNLIEESDFKEPRFICKGCNQNENSALEFLQNNGIRDRHALATIMGNIRQESTFVSDICEGGARTTYHGCRTGGFGIIQWTSADRYAGLGQFARRTNGNPSSIETQLKYMLEEPQWLRIEQRMRAPGKTIDRYMAYARSWIGWGVHGSRTQYAEDYANRLVPEV